MTKETREAQEKFWCDVRRISGELVIKCARCGRRMIAQSENATVENDAMEICSDCSWAVSRAQAIDDIHEWLLGNGDHVVAGRLRREFAPESASRESA